MKIFHSTESRVVQVSPADIAKGKESSCGAVEAVLAARLPGTVERKPQWCIALCDVWHGRDPKVSAETMPSATHYRGRHQVNVPYLCSH